MCRSIIIPLLPQRNDMLAQVLLTFIFLLINCAPNDAIDYWQRRTVRRSRRRRDCSLWASKNGISAGSARDVKAECKFDAVTKKFFNEISWRRPLLTKTPVSRYKLEVRYSGMRPVCFQLDSTLEKFIFNTSVGFQPEESMKFVVIPQPIVRIGGKFSIRLKKVRPCPTVIRLLPLPNKAIMEGSEFSFDCRFEEAPVQNLTIEWYFSKDFQSCTENRRLLQSMDGFELSKNNRSLRIIKAKYRHVGCYVVKVRSGIGDELFEEKGYLRINETRKISRKSMKEYNAKKREVLITLSVAAGILVFLTLMLTVRIYFKKHKFQLLTTRDEPASSVYISHCLEEPSDKIALFKFVGILKSNKINVILDLCSAVQINTDGGLSRWIPANMETADKIVVILTPLYINILQSSAKNKSEQNIRKVHAEYTYINSILHNTLHKSNKVILLSKSVKPDRFPLIFQNKVFYEFPKNFDSDENKNLDEKFQKIIENLLDKGFSI